MLMAACRFAHRIQFNYHYISMPVIFVSKMTYLYDMWEVKLCSFADALEKVPFYRWVCSRLEQGSV